MFARPRKPSHGSLEDPWARLRRAENHLKVLEAKHRIGPHLESYRLRVEMHNDGLEYRFYLAEPIPEIDQAVPFIVSEFLFNVRSALDQLVYQLHVRRYRGRVPPEVETRSAFPIITRDPGSDARPWRGIESLGKRERAAIKQFQPYLGGNGRIHQTREHLALLDLMNNIDKHRRLHVIRAIPAAVSKSGTFPPGRAPSQTINFCDLVPGAYVERWTFTEPPDEMPVDHYCWPQIVVDEPTRNLRVILEPFLRTTFGNVAYVIERFNTRFGYEPWRRWNSGAPSELRAD